MNIKIPRMVAMHSCDFFEIYYAHILYLSIAMELLMKLKGELAQLCQKEPKHLQERANACTSTCDEVLQKFRSEKMELERELESKNACIDDLTKQLDFYRQIIRIGKGKKFFGIHLV